MLEAMQAALAALRAVVAEMNMFAWGDPELLALERRRNNLHSQIRGLEVWANIA